VKAGLFVDTAGWVAMVDAADPAHQASRAARDEWFERGGVLVSTDYILRTKGVRLD
jgi:predicted nucleic acid-binding protein